MAHCIHSLGEEQQQQSQLTAAQTAERALMVSSTLLYQEWGSQDACQAVEITQTEQV